MSNNKQHKSPNGSQRANPLTRKSVYVSFVLRHGARELGLTVLPGAWIPVDEVLAAAVSASKPITREELEQIVREDEKTRYGFSDGGRLIRAHQGHSFEVDMEFEQVTPPPVLYHGTARRHLNSIMAQGLVKGDRHHVHMTESLATAKQTGQRHDKGNPPVLLRIDAARMHQDGFTFLRSTNNVWLTDRVPSRYLQDVTEQV